MAGEVRYGMARFGRVGLGQVWWHLVMCVVAWQARSVVARFRRDCRGELRYVMAGKVRPGASGSVEESRGLERQVWIGTVRRGASWCDPASIGLAGVDRLGTAGRGQLRLGMAGVVGPARFWWGGVRLGMARQGGVGVTPTPPKSRQARVALAVRS